MSQLNDRMYDLTSFQEGILVYSEKNTVTTDYIMQNTMNIVGKVNYFYVKKSLELLAQKHEVLLTKIIYDENYNPKQKIFKDSEIELDVIDYSKIIKDEKEKRIQEILIQDQNRGFVLSRDLLFRAKLIILEDNSSKLIFTYHHIILDSKSVMILCKEFVNFYRQLQNCETISVAKVPNFSDYVNWVNNQSISNQLEYWKFALQDYNEVAEITPILNNENYENILKTSIISLDDNEVQPLIKLSEKLQVPFATILKTAWGKILSLQCGTNDVVFGDVISGRDINLKGIQEMVGVFINTLPLRVTINEFDSIDEVIIKTYQVEKENNQHSLCSLAEIQALTELKKDIFRTIFVFEDYFETNLQSKECKDIEFFIDKNTRKTNYDISISTYFEKGKLMINLLYNSGKYSEEAIECLLLQLKRILIEMGKDSTQEFAKIDYLGLEEKNTILNIFNKRITNINEDDNIVSLFEGQLSNCKDKTAVIFKDRSITYEELEEKSNMVAWKLAKKGIKKGNYVGLVAERSVEMIIGILGILKVGGVYVPIDPTYPKERIEYILSDCQPQIILQYHSHISSNIETINIDSMDVWDESKTSLKVSLSSNDLAYIIYTSGTTGNPKGVMVEHKGIVNLQDYFAKEYKITSNDRVAQFANIVFDASIWEISMALLNGAALVVIPNEYKEDTYALSNYFKEHNVTVATLPPNYFLQTEGLSLRILITAGSESSYDIIRKVGTNSYINAYGPTETTICATDWKLGSTNKNYRTIPIGKPINNMQAYIMNEDNLAGILVPGELCIGGVGIARGYLNRESLTKQKFTINPFSQGKLYRTGDLARWLPDGSIEFLGRIDNQVKVRGFRVELGEIESKLRNMDVVKDVAVVLCKDKVGDKVICAYIVLNRDEKVNTLRAKLRENLPDYMIPTYFCKLDAIPVNKNGKIDIKALPKIEMNTDTEYVASRNHKEEVLCTAFEEVLGIQKVGVFDSFSALGGDSIKAIRLVSKLRTKGYEVSVKDILSCNIVEAIAKKLTISLEMRSYNQGQITGKIYKTPMIQEFEEWNLAKPSHFNQDVMIPIPDLDENSLNEVINAIILHHDMLRAVYQNHELKINTDINNNLFKISSYDMGMYKYGTDEIKIICNRIQESFDLEEGPLFKAVLFKFKDRNGLFLCAHHLVIDGVSWRIIIEDIQTAIKQKQEGLTVELPKKTASFKMWSEYLHEYSNNKVLKKEAKYWRRIAEKASNSINRISNGSSKNRVGTMEFSFDSNFTNRLVHKSLKAFQTNVFDLLVAAFSQTFAVYDKEDSLVLLLESHGREEIHKKIDIDRTVGWFTTVYPIVMEYADNLNDFIVEAKEAIHNVPKHGFDYGFLKNSLPKIENNIYFNYLGQMDSEDESEGIYFNSIGERSAKENGIVGNMNVSAVIINKKLLVTIKYRENWCDSNHMKEFTSLFKKNIEQVVNYCAEQLDVHKTPSDYSAKYLSSSDYNLINNSCEKAGKIQDIFSLVPLQEGILFEYLKNKNTTKYVIQQVIKLGNNTKENILKQAIKLCVLRHDALRIAIMYENLENPRQVIFEEREFEYESIDLSNMEEKMQTEYFQQILTEDVERGFDLERDTLFRVKYIYQNKQTSKLVLSFHHIIIDGWSQSIIYNSIQEYYELLLEGSSYEELRAKILMQRKTHPNYGAYLKRAEELDREDGLEFWRDLLKDYESVTKIKSLEKPEKSLTHVKEQKFSLPKEVSEKLYQFSINNAITLSTIVETAIGIVLQRYNATEESVIGKVVSGRDINIPQVEEMVGLFVNTIPVLISTKEKMSIRSLLQAVQKQDIECLNYAYNSLAEIQRMSKLKSNLFHTLFVFENHFDETDNKENNKLLQFKLIKTREETGYDQTIFARMVNEILFFDIMYNPNIFGDKDIERFGERICNVLMQFANSVDQLVSEMSIINAEEEVLVTEQFNQTVQDFSKNKTVMEVFEECVKKQPEAIFAECGNVNITYSNFNRKANQIAWKLRSMGVKENDFVAIIAERSIEMLLGIYGVMKAGAAYVPIDPTYPVDRIQYMINDCHPKVILLYKAEIETEIPCIDLSLDCCNLECEENPMIMNKLEDRLYLIYTSGTTGKPKGVINRHIGVLNLFYWFVSKYSITKEDVVLFKTTYIFDVSVSEILLPVFTGAKLIVAPQGAEKDPDMLASLIVDKQVTLVNFVPSMLSVFLQFVEKKKKLSSLRYVFAAGEALGVTLVQKFYSLVDKGAINGELVNLYGPTEATIYATYYDCTPHMEKSLIGKPVGNLRLYILQNDMLCGVGIPGELCIAGYGVAEGYLNQEEMTNKKFINFNRFNEKMYRTGDLAQWLPDGNIEYLGRIDDQVKVRGFRIEIGEIETCIQSISGIKEAAVVIRKSTNDNVILAYVTSDKQLDIESIRNQIGQKLPKYMVPSQIMQIDMIPTTSNGKLDRRALTEFKHVKSGLIEMPKTELEKQLHGFFEEILELDQIGIDDNFFEIGGHSLSAMRLLNLISFKLGAKIGITDIFALPTVRKLADFISNNKDEYVHLAKVQPKDEYVMSPAQKRIYIVNHMDQSGRLYNMPMGYRVGEIIDSNKVLDSLQKLVRRHEILRTTFFMRDNDFYQKISNEIKVDYTYTVDLNSSEKSLFDDFVQPFQLDKGPLFRTKVVERNNYCLIFFDIHHIISDGISFNLFLQEFCSLYNGIELKPIEAQFKEYSEWFNTLNLSDDRDFWIKTIGENIPVLNMPLDEKRPEVQSHSGKIIKQVMGINESNQLRKLSKSTGATEYMIFVSALMVLLSKYSYQDEIIVGSPIGGRIHKDTETMLGVFINTIPIKGSVKANITFREFLEEIKEYCIKAYQHQKYPFEQLVEDLNIERDMSRNPLFDVMLTYHNSLEFNFNMGKTTAQMIEQSSTVSKFDLDFTIMQDGEEFSIWLEYCDDLFHDDNAKRILDNYILLLKNILNNYESKIKEISFLEHKDLKLMNSFNMNEAIVLEDVMPIEFIEKNAILYPDRIAVLYENKSITFRELDNKAQIIASQLHEFGVKAGDLVPIIASRSVEFIIAICGVLKAGAAYVPVDNNYPKERIDYILEDCNPNVVLVYEYDKCDKEKVIDLANPNLWNSKVKPFSRNIQSSDLIYCIYTSGTSGNPKGVLVEQRGVVNLCTNVINKIFHKDQVDIVALMASFAFDSSVKMIFTSLMFGKTLHIISNQRKDNVQDLLEYIENNKIEAIDFTPAYLRIIQSEIINKNKQLNLKVILAGGEELTIQDLKLIKWNENIHIYNVYGPTEATVDTTVYKCTGSEKYRIPIGSPIANAQIYIINNGNLCGIGVPGELCIAGMGIARGYLNNSDLTKEKFIQNPFGKGILYKSGDLARWNSDGTIEFMGRIDEQVKIRGYRVEPAEITYTIKNLLDVKDVATLISTDENNTKAIYVFLVAEIELDIDEVRSKLASRLPQYMMPSFIKQISEIPVTNHGKVDRKALLAIKQNEHHDYCKPTTEEEVVLCKVFEEVLNEKNISIRDSFFEIGGDSIKAIIIVSKLKNMGYVVSVRDIISYYTIEKIAPYVKKESLEVYSQTEVSGHVIATPIICDFNSRNLPKPEHFCQDVLIDIGKMNEEDIRSIFDELTKHHDILRSIYPQKQLIIQNINDWNGYELSVVTIDSNSDESTIEKICSKVQKSFDLINGPLIKLVLFKLSTYNQLFICIHHLIVDGVSWRILLDDFNLIAEQRKANKQIRLPMKTASYLEWSEAVEEFKNSKEFKKEQVYWNQVEEEMENSDLPVENRADLIISHVGKVSFELDEHETNILLKEANRAYSSKINDLLLSALSMAIRKQFNLDKITVFIEGHGREELNKPIDITRTIGWFTTKYPVILSCYDDIVTSICNTKDTLHQVMKNGFGYGLARKTNPEKQGDIYFNYLGDVGSNIKFCEIGESIAKENGILGIIDINGMVIQGKLVMDIAYNTDALSEKVITNFLKLYQQSLIDILTHCSSQLEVVKTASDYLAPNLSTKELKEIYEFYGKNNVVEICSLTPMQEGMLFHKLSDPNSSAYIVQVTFDINDSLDIKYLEQAIKLVIDKYPILRTSYLYEGVMQPRQVVLANKGVHLTAKNLSDIKKDEVDNRIADLREEELNRGFDIQKDILIRFLYIELPNHQYKLVITHHHIILDGWCLSVIMKDIEKLYYKIKNKSEIDINCFEERNDPFIKYLTFLDKQNMTEAYDYFDELLDSYEASGNIKGFSSVVDTKSYVKKVDILLTKEQSNQIENAANKMKVTSSTLFETAWGLLLQKHNYSNDVVFGKVVSGRHVEIKDIDLAVGPFVNTIPVRVQCENQMTIADLLKNMSQQGLKSIEYSYCSLSEIQNNTLKKNQLFQTLYVFENYYVFEENKKNTFILEAAREQTNYDLTVSVYYDNTKETYSISIMYDNCKYCERDVKWILKQYEHLLSSMVQHIFDRIQDIELTTDDEKRMIKEFNKTETDYDSQKSIMQIYQEQVIRNPEAIAVIYENIKLTYKELNQVTNGLANKLIHLGVHKGDFIMIMGEKRLETIIGICGILKAGAVYVPIDPNYPDERIQYMIKDCNPVAILIHDRKIQTEIPMIQLNDVFCLDESQKNPDINVNSDDLAYVIYTSGTMGHPKGSLIRQKSVVRLVNKTNYIELNQSSVILLTGSLAFDASTLEIWGALLNGGTLILGNDEVITSSENLKNYIIKYSVNTMWLTASLYNQMIQMDVTMFSKLKYLLIGGEKLSEKHVKMFKENNKDTILINGYGPTENTTFTTTYCIPTDFDNIYIGKPISNTQVYILNEEHLCGIGMPGQLCIAGDGLATGYLNQPELTKEKFIKNPFGDGMLYLSGDLGRWTMEGNIDYIGRIDSQVKLRGYRIELSEIEKIIKKLENVNDVCVLAKDGSDGEKEIYAYLTANTKLAMEDTKNQLRTLIPEYMIPAYMMQIEKMPLTIQGKIDKRMLPDIVKVSDEEYEAPRNEIERVLCCVLKQVLGVEKVGVKDSFFALGGDSIKAIRVVSRMRSEGYEIEVKDIMTYYVVELIAQFVKNSKNEYKYEQGEITGIVKSTPIIRTFCKWNFVKPNHFNQDVLLDIDTNDIIKINQCFIAIVKQHDILRAVFHQGFLEIMPYDVNSGYELSSYDLSQEKGISIEDECSKIQASIDLEHGPLMKVALFHSSTRNQLFICIHHLVVDSVSWQIILEDIKTVMNQLKHGLEISLPEKTASYLDWSKLLDEYRLSNEIQSQKEYWKNVVEDTRNAKLKLDKQGDSSGFQTVEVNLECDLTEALLKEANQAFNTKINDLLISGLVMAVNEMTSQRKIAIIMEGHGREELHRKIKIDRTVGWFTSMYPLVVSCKEDIQQTIINTKEIIRKIPNNGIGYGVLQDQLPSVDIDITFNYLGQIGESKSDNNIKFFETGKSIADENKLSSGISISGSIDGKNLLMKFNFNASDYNYMQIENFARIYLDMLKKIIQYCINRDDTSKTISDMDTEDLLTEDLENINLLF